MAEKVCPQLSGWDLVKCIWERYSALWIVPGFILGITFGIVIGYSIPNDYQLLENMIPEVVGIGVSITGIYYLERWREDKVAEAKLKEELTWQVRSKSNETAKLAIDRMRHNGWLTGKDSLLKNIDLSGSNLSGADLSNANLSKSNISRVNLKGADLRWANLSGVDLRWANLSDANLIEVILKGADLRWANLSRAYLSGADFTDTVLQETTLPDGKLWTPNTNIKFFTKSFDVSDVDEDNLDKNLLDWLMTDQEITKYALNESFRDNDEDILATLFEDIDEDVEESRFDEMVENFQAEQVANDEDVFLGDIDKDEETFQIPTEEELRYLIDDEDDEVK